MNKKVCRNTGGIKSTGFGFLLLAGLTLTFLGCPSPSGGTPALTGTVAINGTAQVGQLLTADTAKLEGTGTISYQWEVGDTVNGTFTDIPDATAETYTPVAADEGKHLRVTVTRSGYTGSATSDATGPVLSASAIIPTVTSVTISPSSATVAKGGYQQFLATVNGTNNPDQTVTWSVTGGGAGTTIDDGRLIVALDETAETLTVTATSTEDTTKFDTATVTITGTVTVTGVTISPSSATVAKGRTRQFSATVDGTNNPAQTVTWSVTGGGAGTTIVDGLLTVAADETANTLTVTATSTIDSTQFGTATVTVIEAPIVTAVTVTPVNAEVAVGASRQFIAEVTGTNDPAKTVTWKVTGALSTGTVIDTAGVLTVAADETAATLTVTATSTEDTTKSDTVTVTITRVPLTGAVTINGFARAGSALTANTNNLFGTGTISYQWQKGDTANGTFTDISDATASTYTPVTADVGKFLRVSVSRAGNTGNITSNAAGPVDAAPSETESINGTVTVNNGIENVMVSFANTDNLTLNKNGSLTVTVSGSYQAFRWYVDTVLLSDETAASITLNGADYNSGDHHRILVIVYRNGIPYSQEIRFTVSQ